MIKRNVKFAIRFHSFILIFFVRTFIFFYIFSLKMLSTYQALRHHMLIHTGEKPQECIFCQQVRRIDVFNKVYAFFCTYLLVFIMLCFDV